MDKEALIIRARADSDTLAREDRIIPTEGLEDFIPEATLQSGFKRWEFIRFMANTVPIALVHMSSEDIEREAAELFENSFGLSVRRN